MENLEGPYGSRRVVLDVGADAPGGRGYNNGGRSKRSRRRRRKKTQQAAATTPAAPQYNDPVDNPRPEIPMELWPVIQAITDYGKKTNAMGAMRAASSLSRFADRLRALGPPTPALERIMMDAQRESEEIRAMLGRLYDIDE